MNIVMNHISRVNSSLPDIRSLSLLDAQGVDLTTIRNAKGNIDEICRALDDDFMECLRLYWQAIEEHDVETQIFLTYAGIVIINDKTRCN